MADRFKITYKQRGWDMDAAVVVDRETGVSYLVMKNGNQVAGITPLLDRDGKPIVSPLPIRED